MEQEKDFITLEFDDGIEVECEILGTYEVGDKEYIALAKEDSEEVFIYRYVDLENDEFELEEIEDEEEFEKAAAEFNRLMEEME